MAQRKPSIPNFLNRKIYKTGQTRGADDDQIFQNRVNRNSTVLIPFNIWEKIPTVRDIEYENEFIVLISPNEYNSESYSKYSNLKLGDNLLIFYELREDWIKMNPKKLGLKEPDSRKGSLGGDFVARIANTTSSKDKRINVGYTSTGLKGAGIRQYEYADSETIKNCRVQLEWLFWSSLNSEEAMLESGMEKKEIALRKELNKKDASEANLIDRDTLYENNIIDEDLHTICPLCREKINAEGFLSRLSQATGREKHDLTVTEINLFHIKELTYDRLLHKPYNLGWGHHHCNVVIADNGIDDTIAWMKEVIERNDLKR